MSRLPFVILLLFFCLVIVSWLGSMYGWGMNSMLSTYGLRWMVAMGLENFKHAPLEEVFLGTMALSTLSESGFLSACRSLFSFKKSYSLKKKRAFQISMLVLLLLLVLIFVATFFPGAVLLSAFGTYQGSAIQMGLYPLTLALFVCVGITYGYASGTFSNASDTIRAIVYLPSRIAVFFVTMFVASQLIGCFHYVFEGRMTQTLMELYGVHVTWHLILQIVLYIVPLTIHIISAYRHP